MCSVFQLLPIRQERFITFDAWSIKLPEPTMLPGLQTRFTGLYMA